MFITALFTTPKVWKELKYPVTAEDKIDVDAIIYLTFTTKVFHFPWEWIAIDLDA